MVSGSSNLSSLILERVQLFSRSGAGFLYDMRTKLDKTVNAAVNTLWNNRKKGSLQCQNTVTYKLSKNAIGELGFGRLYGSAGSLERMEKECRGVLCKEFYYDLDIVNCHPVILVQFARNRFSIDLPELEKYVLNRDAYLSKISSNRDDAKTAILKILYGGKADVAFLEPMAKEIRDFTKMLSTKEEYTQLFAACKTHKELKEWEKKVVTGIYGTFLSAILQTEERNCMLLMTHIFEQNGWSVDVFCYDGIMVRIRKDAYVSDIIPKCEAYILETLGYQINIINKPFITFAEFEALTTSNDLYKGVSMTDYSTLKREFEMTNFYYAPTDEYCEYETGKSPLHMSAKHANAYYSSKWIFRKSQRLDDFVCFFDLWKTDPTRRVIKSLSLAPSENPEVFTIPIQLQYMKGDTGASDIDLSLFNELVSTVCSHKQPLINYTLNWLAHLLQKPFDLPGVGLIFTGSKGVGKDTLWDFFMTHVIGELYSFNYSDTKMFFEKHDCNLMNKFLIKLEEADSKICLENANVLKGRITGSSITFNPKNAKSIKTENFTRFVMTTNGTCPVETSNGERRFVVIPCSNEKKGDRDFWNTIRETMFNDAFGHAVAKMLLEKDLTGFDVRKLPENEYQDAVLDSRKSSEDRFVEDWDGEECSVADLHNKYTNYCIEHDLPFISTPNSLCKALLRFVRDTIKVRRVSAGMLYSKM